MTYTSRILHFSAKWPTSLNKMDAQMTEKMRWKSADKREALHFSFSSSLKPATISLPDLITHPSHNIPFSSSTRIQSSFKTIHEEACHKNLSNCLFYLLLQIHHFIWKLFTEDAAKTLLTYDILYGRLLMGRPFLSSTISRKFRTFKQDSFSWHPIITTLKLLLEKLHLLPI